MKAHGYGPTSAQVERWRLPSRSRRRPQTVTSPPPAASAKPIHDRFLPPGALWIQYLRRPLPPAALSNSLHRRVPTPASSSTLYRRLALPASSSTLYRRRRLPPPPARPTTAGLLRFLLYVDLHHSRSVSHICFVSAETAMGLLRQRSRLRCWPVMMVTATVMGFLRGHRHPRPWPPLMRFSSSHPRPRPVTRVHRLSPAHPRPVTRFNSLSQSRPLLLILTQLRSPPVSLHFTNL